MGIILCSIFKDKNKAMPIDMFESYGTIRFINIFPLVISAILNGGTLVVDEFDASLHPMALMSIINIFHNDEINIPRFNLSRPPYVKGVHLSKKNQATPKTII